MPEQKHQRVGLGVLTFVWMTACGQIPTPTAPEYVIEESEVTTPAGTAHTQVFVPAGTFYMGSENGPRNERPVHEVELDAFHIDKFEVTNAQYMAYVGATDAWAPQYISDGSFNQPGQPVVGVSWQQARGYCEWAGMQLPTEAQWEKAAAGIDGRTYPWGNESADDTRGNFNFSTELAPVGSFPAGVSPYGAHDMAGNVWEWTLDEYDGGYYARSPMYNPVNVSDVGLGDGPDRTLRGGGWFSSSREVHVSVRSSIYILGEKYEAQDDYSSALMYARIGFRCARNNASG